MKVSTEVEQALTQAGGRNYRGEPNYRFAWSAHETQLISNGTKYEHFRVCAEDCWLLMKWEDADFWGSQVDWKMTNWEQGRIVERNDGGIVTFDPLFTAGPYPINGRYRMVRHLKKVVIRGGEMHFEHPAPDINFVREIFPDIKAFLDLTTEKKAELLTTREREEKEQLAKNFAASRDNYRGSATSKQIQDRVEGIERFLSDPTNVQQVREMTKRRA